MTARVGAHQATFPVYATIWLAPLAQWIHPNFILWLAGESGSLKSSLASAAQAHFGRFSYAALPENWISTAGAIEQELWQRKDALVTIDNYVPGLSHDLPGKVNRVIQASGDQSARNRLNRDATRKPSRRPRCVAIATGEDVPSGSSTSTVGRLLVLRVRKGQLNMDALIDVCRGSAGWPLLLRAYTDWLAQDVEGHIARFREVEERAREAYAVGIPGLHPRTAGNVAQLGAALSVYWEWLDHLGLSDYLAGDWEAQLCVALDALARAQGDYHEQARPCDRYRDAIAALLTSGQAMLAGRDYELGEKDIGWYDDTHAYLHPDLTWAAVVRFAGGPMQWPYSKTELHRALVDAGYVVRPAGSGTDAARRITTDVRLGSGKGDAKARRRVLVVPRAVLDDAVGLWAKAPSQVTGTRSAELEPELGLN